eukprot:1428217-Rhodomonas_salina.2
MASLSLRERRRGGCARGCTACRRCWRHAVGVCGAPRCATLRGRRSPAVHLARAVRHPHSLLKSSTTSWSFECHLILAAVQRSIGVCTLLFSSWHAFVERMCTLNTSGGRGVRVQSRVLCSVCRRGRSRHERIRCAHACSAHAATVSALPRDQA